MAFVRPDAPESEAVTLSMLSHEDQEQLITGVKTAIEDCLGEDVRGFRCYRFDQNEDTYAIVDALGFDFNLGFVARTDCSLPGHDDDSLPYQSPEYNFWAVPMHSVCTDGQCTAFCDMPFRNLEADEWEALLISEFDTQAAQGHPLLVEFHPYYTGTDEGRFEAFVSFLDYALEKGARFLTVAELVEQTGLENNSGCTCDE
jgi:peptidoglycan/xylan/chitin deacetylase (PgdA/CDA1 family)